MLSKNQIKFLQSLKLKKNREAYSCFVAEGTKIVLELINSSIKVEKVFATSSFLSDTTIPKNIEITEVSEKDLERISFLSTPNQVLAVCKQPTNLITQIETKNKLILALDDIKDPGNLGTIIRIADWFGIEQIVCSHETVEVFNPKVIQATMGSIARVKIFYTDLLQFLQTQKANEISIFGAFLDGENIFKIQKSNGILLIGNESAGISENLTKYITTRINIPSFSHLKNTSGEAESLNAAIATAIICAEFRRSL